MRTVAEGAMMEAIQGRAFSGDLWYTQRMLYSALLLRVDGIL
jgi:hypothetical protein